MTVTMTKRKLDLFNILALQKGFTGDSYIYVFE